MHSEQKRFHICRISFKPCDVHINASTLLCLLNIWHKEEIEVTFEMTAWIPAFIEMLLLVSFLARQNAIAIMMTQVNQKYTISKTILQNQVS